MEISCSVVSGLSVQSHNNPDSTPQKKQRTMKTKTTIGGFIALLFAAASATATPPPLPPTVVVKAAIVVNGSPTSTTVATLPAKVTVADVGLSQIVHLGTGLQFEFQDSAGHPVNVDGFKAAKAEHSLIGNGTAFWTNTPLGSFHPDDQGSPDYHVYNASGADVTPSSGFVTGYMGDNSGAVLPPMSRFQVLDQTITLGGTSGRPLLAAAGNYYSFTYTWVFSYSYGGTTYTKTLSSSDTEVMVQVVAGLPDFFKGEEGVVPPCLIHLEVSENLADWVIPPGVVIPNPRPTNILNIVDLLKSTSAFSGQTNGGVTRFYRYVQSPILP